jgi:recombination protein RecR
MSRSILETLIDTLRYLPGVGPKTAARMAYQLLEKSERAKALEIAAALTNAVANIKHCKMCRDFTENDLCSICNNSQRDRSLLCIVETPIDVISIEQTNTYHGLYFVLMGHLSPLDGIGPKELELDNLKNYIEQQNFAEIIIATNPTMEGEATAHYISNMIDSPALKFSRIAHGVPMGGELEYLDGNTVARALNSRTLITNY